MTKAIFASCLLFFASALSGQEDSNYLKALEYFNCKDNSNAMECIVKHLENRTNDTEGMMLLEKIYNSERAFQIEYLKGREYFNRGLFNKALTRFISASMLGSNEKIGYFLNETSNRIFYLNNTFLSTKITDTARDIRVEWEGGVFSNADVYFLNSSNYLLFQTLDYFCRNQVPCPGLTNFFGSIFTNFTMNGHVLLVSKKILPLFNFVAIIPSTADGVECQPIIYIKEITNTPPDITQLKNAISRDFDTLSRLSRGTNSPFTASNLINLSGMSSMLKKSTGDKNTSLILNWSDFSGINRLSSENSRKFYLFTPGISPSDGLVEAFGDYLVSYGAQQIIASHLEGLAQKYGELKDYKKRFLLGSALCLISGNAYSLSNFTWSFSNSQQKEAVAKELLKDSLACETRGLYLEAWYQYEAAVNLLPSLNTGKVNIRNRMEQEHLGAYSKYEWYYLTDKLRIIINDTNRTALQRAVDCLWCMENHEHYFKLTPAQVKFKAALAVSLKNLRQ